MAKKCDEMQRLFLIRLDNYVIVYFKQYVFFTISEFKTQTNKFQPKKFFSSASRNQSFVFMGGSMFSQISRISKCFSTSITNVISGSFMNTFSMICQAIRRCHFFPAQIALVDSPA